MRSWLNFNRSILLFCSVLMLLLLWLSISILLQAYNARQDARFLARYLQTESVLRDTVTAVAEERSASHWLTSLQGIFSAQNSLGKTHSKTNQAFDVFYHEIEQALAYTEFANQLTYQPAHIRILVGNLRSKTNDLALRRDELIANLDLPLDKRNQRLELSVFDYYGDLISQLEELRHAFSYRPTALSREVEIGLTISESAWNLKLSHHVLSALFEGFITSGKTALGTAYERSVTMQRSVDRHWDQIKNIEAYNSVDKELHAKVFELNEWFGDTYYPRVKRITRAIGEMSPSPYPNWEWRRHALELEMHIVEIMERANGVSVQQIDAALSRANRNLMIDVFLVVLCAGLMAGALRIGQRMYFQANHDDLTQLSNRRMFQSQSELLLHDAGSKRRRYVLIVLNLDDFKSVNDSLGHSNGDRVLQHIAKNIVEAAGKGAVVARMGGDEFSVLKRYDDDASAWSIVEQVAGAASNRVCIDSHTVSITARVGYSLYPRDAVNLEGLCKAADLAIYTARQKGTGVIEAFKPAIASAFQELQSLKADLSKAIENNEFQLHYQPQVDLARGVVEGVEALLRWNHPVRGNVPPFRFIGIAEDAGLMPQIGQWVIEESARQAASWRDINGLELRVSVNVSVHQFLQGDIASIVRHALATHYLDPRHYEIEITETAAMAEMSRVLEKLQTLRQLGVRVALDDFGTGYSSLGYLQDLPLDTLKIDRSFITKLDGGGENQRVLLDSIAHIARSLKFHTVAEGVETDIQLHHVRALGIDMVQGYYFSKPLPASVVPATVAEINQTHGNNAQHAA